MIKTIILDFDGTIGDTERVLFVMYNEVAGSFGLRKVDENEIEEFKNKSARETMQLLKISFWKLPFLIWRLKKMLLKRIDEVKIFPGIREAVEQIKNRGVEIGIVSSDSKENILKVLGNFGMQELFDFIDCNSSIWGKHKAIARALRNNAIKMDEAVYVGDEVRDINACRKVGIKVASVTWGFNSEKVLRENDPDYLISKPEELIELIK